jgi:hypothetical protein
MNEPDDVIAPRQQTTNPDALAPCLKTCQCGGTGQIRRVTGTYWHGNYECVSSPCPTFSLSYALKAVMDDFGVDSCYCTELAQKGQCGFCLATKALKVTNAKR